MATKHPAFFRSIKPYCFGVWKEFGVLPSVTAAQCSLESKYGQSGLTKAANNYFGIKAVAGQNFYPIVTKEYGPSGPYYITAKFAKYETMGESFAAYGNLINKPRYRAAVGQTDYVKALTAIRNGGYATDPSYVSLAVSVIRSNGYDAWDREALNGGDGGYTGDLAGMNVSGGFGGVVLEGEQFQTFNNKFIAKNKYTRPGDKLKGVQGIVIREVGTKGIKSDAIRTHLNKGGNGRNDEGFHILIDKNDTVCIVPLDEQVPHSVGKSNFEPFGANANQTTLSVGLCREQDGTFADETLARGIAVVAELVNRYGFPVEFVKRGYDVDGKHNPEVWTENQFLYSSFLGVVNYQKNQPASPLLNEDLIAYYQQQQHNDLGLSEGQMGKVTVVGNGTVAKLQKLALQLQGYNMKYYLGNPPYIRPGGRSDCSSFMQYIYKHAANINLPRVSADQARLGRTIRKDEAMPGDLVFFTATKGGGRISHVGMVWDKGGNKMINSAVNRGGNTIVIDNIFATYWNFSHFKRILSENDINNVETGSSTGSAKELDRSKNYAIKVKDAVNGYSTDSKVATSVKKYARGTVLRVRSVGNYAYRVEDGVWVMKSDAQKYELYPTGDISNPIGVITTNNPVIVKTAPSHVAPNVVSSGSALRLQEGLSLQVYAKQNGMALISNPGETGFEQWISISSSHYEDLLEGYGIAHGQEVEDNPGNHLTEGGPATTIQVGNFMIEGEPKRTSTGTTPEQGRTVAADPTVYPLGSRLRIMVPSRPEYSGEYVVEHTLKDSPTKLSLYFEDNRDRVLYGTRAAEVTVL